VSALALERALAYRPDDISPSEKAVLFYYAWRAAKETLLAWPSIAEVAAATALSPRAVQYALASLCSREVMVATNGRSGGAGKTTVYRVMLPEKNLPAQKGAVSPERVQSEGRNGATAAPKGAMVALANKEKTERQETPKSERPCNPTAKHAADIWQQALVRLWRKINRHSYDTWLKPSRGERIENGDLVVSVPTPEFLHIADRWRDEIAASLSDATDIQNLRFETRLA
jgi:hypothetical protein